MQDVRKFSSVSCSPEPGAPSVSRQDSERRTRSFRRMSDIFNAVLSRTPEPEREPRAHGRERRKSQSLRMCSDELRALSVEPKLRRGRSMQDVRKLSSVSCSPEPGAQSMSRQDSGRRTRSYRRLSDIFSAVLSRTPEPKVQPRRSLQDSTLNGILYVYSLESANDEQRHSSFRTRTRRGWLGSRNVRSYQTFAEERASWNSVPAGIGSRRSLQDVSSLMPPESLGSAAAHEGKQSSPLIVRALRGLVAPRDKRRASEETAAWKSAPQMKFNSRRSLQDDGLLVTSSLSYSPEPIAVSKQRLTDQVVCEVGTCPSARKLSVDGREFENPCEADRVSAMDTDDYLLNRFLLDIHHHFGLPHSILKNAQRDSMRPGGTGNRKKCRPLLSALHRRLLRAVCAVPSTEESRVKFAKTLVYECGDWEAEKEARSALYLDANMNHQVSMMSHRGEDGLEQSTLGKDGVPVDLSGDFTPPLGLNNSPSAHGQTENSSGKGRGLLRRMLQLHSSRRKAPPRVARVASDPLESSRAHFSASLVVDYEDREMRRRRNNEMRSENESAPYPCTPTSSSATDCVSYQSSAPKTIAVSGCVVCVSEIPDAVRGMGAF